VGAAKQRKNAGARISHCRTCTLCCSLPHIEALEKPAYQACCHIMYAGCSLFCKPERPAPCIAYECAYLSGKSGRPNGLKGASDLPHPLECGAYFHLEATSRTLFVFIDPHKPERWKSSRLMDVFRASLSQGYGLFITDRGRTMLISELHVFEALLAHDVVAFANSEQKPLDIPSFAD
jgi:hypothetical protein